MRDASLNTGVVGLWPSTTFTPAGVSHPDRVNPHVTLELAERWVVTIPMTRDGLAYLDALTHAVTSLATIVASEVDGFAVQQGTP